MRLEMTASMMPYSLASAAVRILSRSMSLATCFGRAPRVQGDDPLHLGAHADDLVRLDLDVRPLAAALGVGLVDEDAGVREREALARAAGGEQDRGGAGRLAQAHRLHLRLDELHRVVDGRHGRVRAAGRVDVDLDVAVGVEGLQREQLGHDVVGAGIVDLHAEEDDALLEELRVRIVDALAVGAALPELREDVAALGGREVVHLASPLPLAALASGASAAEL